MTNKLEREEVGGIEGDANELSDSVHHSRITLIWDVLILQAKLLADGLRDVLLVPVSLGALLFGLVAGGSDPGRLFRKVMVLGRRTEHWINLFGYRKHGTADELITPLKAKMDSNVYAQKAGDSINKSLDKVNEHLKNQRDD